MKQLKLENYQPKPKEFWEKYIQASDSFEVINTARQIFGFSQSGNQEQAPRLSPRIL